MMAGAEGVEQQDKLVNWPPSPVPSFRKRTCQSSASAQPGAWQWFCRSPGPGQKQPGPAKGREARARSFLPIGWHSGHLLTDPLCPSPWAGVKERGRSQDLGPGAPVALRRIEAWRHENI